MINNRQNGRRRGRGGPRPDGMQNRPSGGGNRPETRARGNAPQLHEKYKSMARDAQLAGDRVQTEYYLQFADHYYRILNENRPRFDESRPRHGDQSQDAGNDDYDDDEMMADEGEDDAPARQQPRGREARPERDERPQREDRPQREARPDREDRPQQRDVRTDRDDRPQRDAQPQRGSYVPEGDDRPQRPRREAADAAPRAPRGDRPVREAQAPRGDTEIGEDRSGQDAVREERPREDRPREDRPRVRAARSENGEAPVRASRARAPRRDEEDRPGIDFDRLPPAISRAEPSAGEGNGSVPADAGSTEDDRPRPVRRPRRPREDTPEAA